jgi:hypothetical protein
MGREASFLREHCARGRDDGERLRLCRCARSLQGRVRFIESDIQLPMASAPAQMVTRSVMGREASFLREHRARGRDDEKPRLLMREPLASRVRFIESDGPSPRWQQPAREGCAHSLVGWKKPRLCRCACRLQGRVRFVESDGPDPDGERAAADALTRLMVAGGTLVLRKHRGRDDGETSRRADAHAVLQGRVRPMESDRPIPMTARRVVTGGCTEVAP